jgi:hypothetical protein
MTVRNGTTMLWVSGVTNHRLLARTVEWVLHEDNVSARLASAYIVQIIIKRFRRLNGY